jgi:hypothetical protein
MIIDVIVSIIEIALKRCFWPYIVWSILFVFKSVIQFYAHVNMYFWQWYDDDDDNDNDGSIIIYYFAHGTVMNVPNPVVWGFIGFMLWNTF